MASLGSSFVRRTFWAVAESRATRQRCGAVLRPRRGALPFLRAPGPVRLRVPGCQVRVGGHAAHPGCRRAEMSPPGGLHLHQPAARAFKSRFSKPNGPSVPGLRPQGCRGCRGGVRGGGLSRLGSSRCLLRSFPAPPPSALLFLKLSRIWKGQLPAPAGRKPNPLCSLQSCTPAGAQAPSLPSRNLSGCFWRRPPAPPRGHMALCDVERRPWPGGHAGSHACGRSHPDASLRCKAFGDVFVILQRRQKL